MPNAEPAKTVAPSQPPVFIVGCGRSGTTLLRLMLSNAGTLMIPPECDFLWRACLRYGPDARMDNERREDFVRYVSRISSFSGLELSTEGLLAGLRSRPPLRLADCIEHIYRTYAMNHGATRWGDKNPFYVLRLDLIHKLFPEARVVHMIRDGRDVAVSYTKTKMRPYNTFVTAQRWKRCIQAGRTWGARHHDRYLEVRYEELIEEPENELRRVCEFIGEEFSPSMLDYHRENRDLRRIPPSDRGHHGNLAKPIMRGNQDKWRKDMTDTDRQIFEAVGGDLLRRLGYPVSESRPRPWLSAYVVACRLRLAIGRKKVVTNLIDATHWRMRRRIRQWLLIDNAHYR